jgi:glyoxylase I family protein
VLPSLGLTQLRVGSSLIDLVDVNGPLGKKGGGPSGLKRRNMDHYCVQLAEFNEQKICAHLKRKGIKIGNVERRYGALGHGPSMYLTDPDGNTLELKGPPDADQTENIPDAIWPKRRRKLAP